MHIRFSWEAQQALNKLRDKGISVNTVVNYALIKFLKDDKDTEIKKLMETAEEKLKLDEFIEQADDWHRRQNALLRHSREYIAPATWKFEKLKDGELSVMVRRIGEKRIELAEQMMGVLAEDLGMAKTKHGLRDKKSMSYQKHLEKK